MSPRYSNYIAKEVYYHREKEILFFDYIQAKQKRSFTDGGEEKGSLLSFFFFFKKKTGRPFG